MNAHTPPPWRVEVESNSMGVIAGSDDTDTFRYVAQDCREADAEFIVVAVNAHQALVDALKLRQDRGHGVACGQVRADHRGGRHLLVPCDCGYEAALAALALAGVKP